METSVPPSDCWNFDNSHSTVGFSIKPMMFAKVRDQFTGRTDSLSYDPENLGAASVEATIQVVSIDTSNEQRDCHLRSADFFDAEKFPVMTFKSESWKKNGDNQSERLRVGVSEELQRCCGLGLHVQLDRCRVNGRFIGPLYGRAIHDTT